MYQLEALGLFQPKLVENVKKDEVVVLPRFKRNTVKESISHFMNLMRDKFGAKTLNGQVTALLGFPSIEYLYAAYCHLFEQGIFGELSVLYLR